MGDRLAPILELTKARFREFIREPGALFWVFGFPVIMVLVLGIAFRNRPPSEPKVGVVVGEAAWLLDALDRVEGVDVERLEPPEADRLLRTGGIDLIVAAQGGGDGRGLLYRYDPTRDGSQSARLVLDAALQADAGRVDVLAVATEEVEERGARYVDFLFPGIVGLNVMSSSLWGIGYSIVLARKRRLLKRLAATPMRRSDFLLAIFLSRLVFLIVEVVALLIFGALAFDVTVEGSYLAVAVVSLVGTASFAGIGLAIAARVESIEAANGWLNMIMMPMWLLSGTFFTYERFPEVLHLPIRALPMTAMNDALRAIVNDGAGLVSAGPEMGVMAAWALVGFAIAHRTFRWQ